MKTDKLIDLLSQNNEPVRPLLSPAIRFILWLLMSTTAVIGVIFIRTYGFEQKIHMPSDIFSMILLAVSVLTISFFAFYINVPESLPSYMLIIPAGIFLLWIVRIIAFTSLQEETSFSDIGHTLLTFGKGHKESCVKDIYLLLILPFIAFMIMLRKGFTLKKTWAVSLAVLGALSIAELGVSIMCGQENSVHLFTWHIIPVIPGGLIISYIAYRLIR